MDNGGGFGGNLADGMAALAVNDSTSANLEDNSYHTNNSDSLYRVMRAVEAAEATIRQQVEENDRLRVELKRKSQELDKIKSDEIVGERPLTDDKWDHHACGPNSSHQSVSPVESHSEINNKMIGILKVHPGSQPPVDNTGFSQFSPQSVASFSPTRYPMEREYDPHFSMPGHGVMTMADISTSSSLWKQIREHEQEIMQLRKHLAEYSVKEAQIRNEKYVLEKRIAYMRMAFDQQQQDLVDATSKALSYRQDIIEENISLTYALQDAQQERTTFVSSLLPLLAEYSLQPQVPDAQSIVSNLKVLFKHLQEKLVVTEAKLKESQYQLAPWHSEVNKSNFAPSSPSYSIGAALATSSKNGLELVPQPTYSVEKIPFSSSEMLSAIDWDAMGHRPNNLDGSMAAKNLETDDSGGYTFLASRASAVHDRPTQIASTHNDSHETPNKQVTFSDPVTATEMDDADRERQQNERERSTNWDSGNPSYTSTHDDPSSSYIPYLPPVLEEPSSSFSEAADDALPAIESLQISGEAFPGRELQACGYSINGTTSCNFEWVRHLENGSVNYIEGAKQPNYLVTADDVDAYLAIEVQPLDNRKRKGELVKVFANEHRKIVCDDDMHHQIEKTLYSGHASYKVSLWTGYLNIWEPASLAVKREGYSIKCTAPSGLGVAEKFSPTTRVIIPFGNPSEFSIIGAGVEHLLRAENIDISCSRDTIVLTMRLFIIRASEKKKGRKKGLFFNK